jgi:hypothetical protein
MADQEEPSARPEDDLPDQGGERTIRGTPPVREDHGSTSDQAIINQEKALESGEENVA